MLFASVYAPVVTDVATDPVYEILINGVPVIVNPVMPLTLQIVPPAPRHVILPEPNAIVRVVAVVELKNPVVNILLLRSRVPFDKVAVCVELIVKAS
jgi:hypothetical protein